MFDCRRSPEVVKMRHVCPGVSFFLHRIQLITDHMYSIMLQCWKLKPEERPTFTQLVQYLRQMTREGESVLQEDRGIYFGERYPADYQ